MHSANLEHEQKLFTAGYRLIAGLDEVGRGALAGPVSVGVAVLDQQNQQILEGLTDSKALTPKRREALIPRIQKWCSYAIGHTTPAEIDVLGMTYALRLAAQRALADLAHRGLYPEAVLLDGKHDWLSPQPANLLDSIDPVYRRYEELLHRVWNGANSAVEKGWSGPVTTIIKGDYQCASIAAASVVAKVDRDAFMESLSAENPHYGWAKNKGYGSVVHRQAISEYGPSIYHRLSWSLPATEEQLTNTRIGRSEVLKVSGEDGES
jgi:ribonuclease HII